ncbi:TetR family transcriptional regulator [Lentilactobacillus fungorum]|uniref:TetR family transcriptional regulator n=1 Tax=Lentilactobacillus fungorum TaxID=2201250 RepID=A0ABQ3VZ33_9LACO|nr:TetR/AcrR family transcriptional regulator C-terminal domain-containing protein [Lentilactobacillus fungorum]GHP14167.1 TetR family transcriptional regulator [Lentilactobacillus fungorum]
MKPVKPTKDTLNRSYILQTALELLDNGGLQKFTMRKLGQKMAVSPMAVYRYFPNQGALFDGLVELIWQKALTTQSGQTDHNWQEQLIRIMAQLRETLLAHPQALSLISTHPLVTQSELMRVEEILSQLKSAGLVIQSTTVFLINSMTAYTLGFVWAEAIEPEGGKNADSNLLMDSQRYSDDFNQLMHPIMTNQFTTDQQFLMGIKALLAGWQ